ncbi:hypothetical protein NCC49_005775 [Naganishia albida]|nr:hypothetical protein NCC49_005775 [Naganishia albida]
MQSTGPERQPARDTATVLLTSDALETEYDWTIDEQKGVVAVNRKAPKYSLLKDGPRGQAVIADRTNGGQENDLGEVKKKRSKRTSLSGDPTDTDKFRRNRSACGGPVKSRSAQALVSGPLDMKTATDFNKTRCREMTIMITLLSDNQTLRA